jgi:hypothetical protein
MKYIRRDDLDINTRITIAIQALACQNVYGARTALAEKYEISRTFLYQLLNSAFSCLTELFSAESRESPPFNRLDTNKNIVSLRLAGKVSIGNISKILELNHYPHHSTGLISENLTEIGNLLPSQLQSECVQKLSIISDELYSIGHPILISIEPKSTAILNIQLASNCQADTWDKHFKEIENANYKIVDMCSDRGTGIMAGFQSACPNQAWFSDHFHEFRDLQKLGTTLERQAYAAIKFEHHRQLVWVDARSAKNKEKQRLLLELSMQDCNLKIQLYQHVTDILALLFPSLYFFDLQNGKLRDAEQVKCNLLTLMDWLDELDYPVLQIETAAIRNHLDGICNCYKKAEAIYKNLAIHFSTEILDFVGLAWQNDHQSAQCKGDKQRYYQAESQFWLSGAEFLLQKENAQSIIAQVFATFNDLIRSSSLIEMVNSLIRPYLNSCKGQITQAHLNLIMFYHNHHRYNSKKRNGKAPIEILNGKPLQKNWLELLFDTVEKNRQLLVA